MASSPTSTNAVVAQAQTWVGTPYGWGQELKGFAADCSGLVQGVFASLGTNLPRTSQAQAQTGTPVASLSDAQPGDLIFFNTGEGANSHVGIYAGNGQMYDAPSTGQTVGLHSIQGYGPITAIRREPVAGSSAPVPTAILGQTQDQRVQLAMLMGSHMEGGWGPNYSVGDNGTSFGPYQMHEGGALGDLPGNLAAQKTEAVDPSTATAAMLPAYQAAVSQVPQSVWQSNPEQAAEQAAVIAERPSQPYYQSQGQTSVDNAYTASLAAMGGAASGGGPGQTSAQSATLTGDILGIPGTSVINPSTYVNDAISALRTPMLRAALIFVGLVLFVVAVVLIGGGASDTAQEAVAAATPSAPDPSSSSGPSSPPPVQTAPSSPAPRSSGTRAKARAVPPPAAEAPGRSVPSGAKGSYRPARRSAGPSRGKGGGGGRFAMDADDAAEAAAL